MARDKYALEGPESTIGKQIGAVMAAAMSQRTAGRGNIVEAPGARLAAGEAAMADDAMWRERIQNIHAMRRVEDRDIALAQRAASMAAAGGRGLQGDQSQMLAQPDQLQAPMIMPDQLAQPQVTPGGFTVTGDNQYVQNLPQQDQFPQAFAGQGSPQFGGTELGMVPEGRRTEQGFSAQDYTTGGAEALGKDMGDAVPVDTVARNALKWVNDLFRGESEEQQQVSGQEGGGVTATGLGVTEGATEGTPITGGLSQDEQMELQQHEQRLAATRPDSNAAATVSWPTIGGDTGNRTRDLNLGVLDRIQTEGLGDTGGTNYPSIGGISGRARDVSGADQNAAIVNSLLRELEASGIGANELRMADIDVDKFVSGVYNMADVDKLMVLANRVGAPPSTRARIQTMSDNVAGTSGRGFDWKDQKYDEAVGRTQVDKYGRLQEEDFMDYTKRMHARNQARNWVDPDKR